jgi:hypothetical protein
MECILHAIRAKLADCLFAVGCHQTDRLASLTGCQVFFSLPFPFLPVLVFYWMQGIFILLYRVLDNNKWILDIVD